MMIRSRINNNYSFFLIAISLVVLTACNPKSESNPVTQKADRPLAKFEPEDGQVLLFVGQELEAIGGVEGFSDGYMDHFDAPAGFTMYTTVVPGNESFGYKVVGLDGVYETADWGDGPSNMSLQLADKKFDNMALAIGLWLVNGEKAIVEGKHDDIIEQMGEFFLSLGNRPVFLRVGYEFDGHAWNHYDIEYFVPAYRRIKDKLDSMNVENVAYVWQSTGWVSDMYMLEDWYPGDDYVDWCAYSFFSRWDEAKMIEFARKKGKPVFIAEASPAISDYTCKFDGDTKETILSNPEQAQEAWEKWFDPFFTTINDNPDVVKAVSYINCNWKSHIMWEENPTFRDVDARLHTSAFISEKWIEETSKDKYLKASEELFDVLWNKE